MTELRLITREQFLSSMDDQEVANAWFASLPLLSDLRECLEALEKTSDRATGKGWSCQHCKWIDDEHDDICPVTKAKAILEKIGVNK